MPRDADVHRSAADGELIDGEFVPFDEADGTDTTPEDKARASTSTAGPSTRTTPAAVAPATTTPVVDPATLTAGKHSFLVQKLVIALFTSCILPM